MVSVACMAILQIEHAITEYETWLVAFESLVEARRRAGVRSGRVGRPVGDPCYIVVSLDFDTIEEATAFLEILETKVWASATTAPALDGRPKTLILESEPAPII
jgi:hypothetical protein